MQVAVIPSLMMVLLSSCHQGIQYTTKTTAKNATAKGDKEKS